MPEHPATLVADAAGHTVHPPGRGSFLTRREFTKGLGAFFTAQLLFPSLSGGGTAEKHPKPLRLGFLTDCHAMADRDVPRWLDQTADLMNSLKPDLIIGGGDFVHDGFGASGRTMEVRWRIAEAFLRRLKTRMEPVIGNHDFYEPLLEDGSPGASDPRWRFRKQFGLDRTYRSFEFRGHRFLILDSIKVVGGANPYRGWIDAAQLAWLDLEIQKIPRNQPIILCSHIPFRTSALDSFGELLAPVSGRVRVLNADVVMEKLKDRHVALILQGHVHLNELLSWSGTTPCITGGAVCGKWWRGSNFGTSPGVGLIEISYQSPEWNYMETPRPPDRGAKGVS